MALTYNIIYFMCSTLYVYFCIPYSLLLTKDLVSICVNMDNLFYHFTLPTSPLLVTTTLFSVLCGIMCFLFGLVWDVHLFCYFFNSSHMSEITFFSV